MTATHGLLKLILAIRAAGGRAYLVGGCVRDTILWRASKDIDVEVFGLHPDTLIDICRQHGSAHEVGRWFGVITMQIDGKSVDISTARTESKIGRGHRGFLVTPSPNMTERDAAARRDFTINSLLMDPITKEVIDFFDGKGDITRGILRATSPAFSEDPLRVLRGMQFAARFQMTMDSETAGLCADMSEEYGSLAVERIWGEWKKWALAMAPEYGLDILWQTGWISFYPQLLLCRGVEQDKEWHPEGDVWTHTRLAVQQAAMIAIREKLNEEDRITLVLSALCHDLGKVTTTEVLDGRIHSHGHAEEGVRLGGLFLQSIGCPDRIQQRVLSLVGEHMWSASGNITLRSVRRLSHRLAAVGNTIKHLALLVEADASGRHPAPKGLPANMRLALLAAEQLRVADAGPIPLMLGRHLIAMGYTPGRQFTTILADCFQKQLDGDIMSVEVGEAYVQLHYPIK